MRHRKDSPLSPRTRDSLFKAFADSGSSRYERTTDEDILEMSAFLSRETTVSSDVDSTLYGVVQGVFVPCFQNILGVILFLRVPWIVGQAGTILSSVLLLICVSATILTTLSLSTLCSNGEIPAGGPYYVVSRNLGAQIGIAVGLLFYMGTAFAGSMYALGAIEALVGGFGFSLFPFGTQLLAIVLVMLAGGTVQIGLKFVNQTSLIFLGAVIVSVLMVLVGLAMTAFGAEENKDVSSMPKFTHDDDLGKTPDFFILLSVLFPGCTGIMAGVNRSGSLQNPGTSIPKGTLSAIFVTFLINLTAIWLCGLSVPRHDLLKDKFVASTYSWPLSGLTVIGVAISSIGALLQCCVGASGLLEALAKDELVPVLNRFRKSENLNQALHATVILISLPCLVGNLDFIVPIVTMSFLLMYVAINFGCFLLVSLKEPSFRPTWKYYSSSSCFMGSILCLCMMFAISWYTALIALGLASCIYVYVGSRRVTKDWGDAMCGLKLSQAKDAIQRLPHDSLLVHRKNWRPQILILCKPPPSLSTLLPKRSRALLDFASQLKQSQGLTVVRSLIDGDPLDEKVAKETVRVSKLLRDTARHVGLVGFLRATIHPGGFLEGSVATIQEAGLAALTPNSVLALWPSWASKAVLRSDDESTISKMKSFARFLKSSIALKKSVLLIKNPLLWPSSQDRVGGYIDIWWVVYDGGLLLLLPYLLKRNRVWKRCSIRLFALSKDSRDAVHLRLKISKMIDGFRLGVVKEVHVLCLGREDVDAFAKNRTVLESSSSSTQRASMKNLFTSPDDVSEEEKKKDDDDDKDQRSYFLRAAKHLNNMICERSGDISTPTSLVVINLPLTRRLRPVTFVEYTETLTKGLHRVLLVRGTGSEFISSVS